MGPCLARQGDPSDPKQYNASSRRHGCKHQFDHARYEENYRDQAMIDARRQAKVDAALAYAQQRAEQEKWAVDNPHGVTRGEAMRLSQQFGHLDGVVRAPGLAGVGPMARAALADGHGSAPMQASVAAVGNVSTQPFTRQGLSG